MSKEIPKVKSCDAVSCVYNKEGQCHTPAITIGDLEPCCDTFQKAESKGGYDDVIGGVGACKVSGCSYNESYECNASEINVVVAEDHADCGTYKPKSG